MIIKYIEKMNISPIDFIQALKAGKSEKELNKKEEIFFFDKEINKLLKLGHDLQSAKEYLSTDFSNGFTVCDNCGSFYNLGKGFTKHLSNGCLHCEGSEKHITYHVKASKPYEGGFPARIMCVMFDDGLHYCKDKIQVELFKNII